MRGMNPEYRAKVDKREAAWAEDLEAGRWPRRYAKRVKNPRHAVYRRKQCLNPDCGHEFNTAEVAVRGDLPPHLKADQCWDHKHAGCKPRAKTRGPESKYREAKIPRYIAAQYKLSVTQARSLGQQMGAVWRRRECAAKGCKNVWSTFELYLPGIAANRCDRCGSKVKLVPGAKDEAPPKPPSKPRPAMTDMAFEGLVYALVWLSREDHTTPALTAAQNYLGGLSKTRERLPGIGERAALLASMAHKRKNPPVLADPTADRDPDDYEFDKEN